MRRNGRWLMPLWLLLLVPSCGDDDAAGGGGKTVVEDAGSGDSGAGGGDARADSDTPEDGGNELSLPSHIQGVPFSRKLDGTNSAFSNQADGLATDAEGNLYVTGFECANVTCRNEFNEKSSRIFVKKFSPSGDPIWVIEFTGMTDAGSPATNNAFDLAVSSEPFIYVNGAFQGELTYKDAQGQTQSISSFEGDLGPSPDSFVAKIAQADGSIEWLERFGGSRDDGGNEIEVDLAGNVVLTLTTNSDSIDIGGTTFGRNTLGDSGDVKPYDSLVVKMTPGGAVSWVQHFNGFGSERLRAIETDGAGNVYAGLEFIRELKVGSTSYDTGHALLSGGAFFRLAADDGSVTFAQPFFENDIFGPEHVSYLTDHVEYNVRGIYADSAENVFVCGVLSNTLDVGKSGAGETVTVSAGDPSAEFLRADFVAIYNQAGEVLWADVIERELGADGCEIDGDYDKNFVMIGSYQGTYRVKRYDASGTASYVTESKMGNTDSELYYLLKYSTEAASPSSADDFAITDLSFLEVGGSAEPTSISFKEGGTVYYNPTNQSISVGARLLNDSEVNFGDLSNSEVFSNPHTAEQGLIGIHTFD